jgi:hypothetical protein
MYGITLEKMLNMKFARLLMLMLAWNGALAAEDVWVTNEASPVWQNECGSCHMAFPPALLTQGNWQQMMQGLDQHFGINASLDAKTRDEIAAFLVRNSGTNWNRSAESLRITQTGYFVKRHISGIQMLDKGRIKSLADCLACHK